MMHERVFVADLQAGHPPLVHVGVFAAVVGHVNRPPAAELAFVPVIEVLEPVQVVQVPLDRGVFAVDLEGVQRLVAAGVAGRLEQSEPNRC